MFKCGCCGTSFESERQDPGHDNRFGTCAKCVVIINQKNEEDWLNAERKVVESLNEKNSKEFLGMEKEVRRGLILKMIDDKVMAFSIVAG